MENCKIAAYIIITMGMLLTSCVKDELHNTPHPDKGAVIVTTDWSARSEEVAIPASHTLRIGEQSQVVTTQTNTFAKLFAQGKYSLLVHNMPVGIAISGTTATVETQADGTLTPQPDYLFSGVAELNIPADDTLRVTVPMRQHIRRLTLVLKLNAGAETLIRSTRATLSGIAHSLDLTTGQPTPTQAGKSVVPTFELTTVSSARAADSWALSAMLRLAGVVGGESQILTIEVTLNSGDVQTITTDLTELLKTFGDNNKALELDAELTIAEDKVSGEFNGTITDWTVVDNGEITIH